MSAGAFLEDRANPDKVAAELADSNLRDLARGPLVLARAWPHRRHHLCAHYVDKERQHPEGSWTLLFPDGEGGSDLAPRAAGQRGIARLGGIGALAQRFPVDPDLPQISAALDAQVSRDELAARRLIPSGTSGLVARVHSYKPFNRCLIVYEGTTGRSGAWTLWAKIYRPAAEAAILEAYAARGASASPGGKALDLPWMRPVGRIPGWRMLVWSHAAGSSLARLLDGDSSQGSTVRSALEATGRALARLQGAPISWPRRHGPVEEIDTIMKWARAAASFNPLRSRAIDDAVQLVRRAAGLATSAPLLPAHRDLHEAQVYLSGDEVRFLDFDTACVAEPELDAANFLAHLRLRILRRGGNGPSDLAARFLEGHACQAGPLDSQRLRWYEAGSLLRLSCVYLFRTGCRLLSDCLLEEAMRVASGTRMEMQS